MSSKDKAPFRSIPSTSIKNDQDKDLYLVYVNKAAQTVEGHLAFVGEPAPQDVVSKEFLYYARMTPQQLEKVRSDPGIFFVHQVTLERAERALRTRGAKEIQFPSPQKEGINWFRLAKGITMEDVFVRYDIFARYSFRGQDETYHVENLTREQVSALKADSAVLFSGDY